VLKEFTDEQCTRFRAMRGDFNTMVRAIHADGQKSGWLEGVEEAAKVADTAKNGIVGHLTAAQAIRALATAPTSDEPATLKCWCPECDRDQIHSIHGHVAECQVCLEPHELTT